MKAAYTGRVDSPGGWTIFYHSMNLILATVLSPYFADFSVPTPQSRKFYFAPYCGLERLYCADCATQFSLGPPSEPFCVVCLEGQQDLRFAICAAPPMQLQYPYEPFLRLYIWRAVHPRVTPFRAIIKPYAPYCAVSVKALKFADPSMAIQTPAPVPWIYIIPPAITPFAHFTFRELYITKETMVCPSNFLSTKDTQFFPFLVIALSLWLAVGVNCHATTTITEFARRDQDFMFCHECTTTIGNVVSTYACSCGSFPALRIYDCPPFSQWVPIITTVVGLVAAALIFTRRRQIGVNVWDGRLFFELRNIILSSRLKLLAL